MGEIAELSRRLFLAMDRLRPNAVGRCFDRLDLLEIPWVQTHNRLTHRRWLRTLAILISRIGNGWLYLVLAVALFVAGGLRGRLVIWSAGLSSCIAHAIYPIFKAFVARPRPYVNHGTVVKLGRPLDLYSFPSGHSMTAAAVFVAHASAFPRSIPVGACVLALVAWARLACAHHYPSDLLCGAVLGAAIAIPVCWLILQ
jgi:undecaprenyl-diphosphatase